MTAPDLVVVGNVRKVYTSRRWFPARSTTVIALDDVSISIQRGSTLALVGASGAGKTTLGRCIARVEKPTAGQICFDGQNIWGPDENALPPARTDVQLLFQDAATALNPRFSAAEIVEEPLLIARWAKQERRRRALDLLDQVQISRGWADRRPAEFSGGQRQRLAFARALALEPKLLILDEALSGVDVSIQAQLINLLLDLQRRFGLTYLLISHDLALVPHIADRVVTMERGRIVKQSSVSELAREDTCSCSGLQHAGLPNKIARDFAAR